MTGMNFTAYVLLTPGADAQAIAANFNAHSEHIKRFQEAGYAIQAELQRLPDVYFLSKGMDAMFAKAGDREETMLWILIGLVVLAIAGINFTNYQLALAPLRIRNINTHKVLGSSDVSKIPSRPISRNSAKTPGLRMSLSPSRSSEPAILTSPGASPTKTKISA